MHRLRRLLLALGLLGQTLVAAEAAAPSTVTPALAALTAGDFIAAEKEIRPLAEAGNADAQHLLGFLYDLGLAVPLDLKAGNAWQEKAAQQDHYWARLYLAWKVSEGLGVDQPDPVRGTELRAGLHKRAVPGVVIPEDWLAVSLMGFSPNYSRATRWLLAQAQAGNALAAFALAEYYYLGLIDRRPNFVEHLRWLQMAAAGNSVPALVRLKLYYALGVLVEKNEPLAREYLARAAAGGDAGSAYELGRNYARGEDGVPQDFVKAREWYERAAAGNHVRGLNALADLLRKGAAGVPVDLVEARRLSSLAAVQHDPEALCDLARMFRDGRGGPKDNAEAMRLYREAADKKYPYAQFMLGWLLRYDSTPPDYAGARIWFETAAAAGNEMAMRELGWLYAQGRGLEKDQATAFVWFEKAAREGDGDAQNQLGWMLRQGIGIELDDEEAVGWFKLAAKNGNWRGDANLAYHYLHGRGLSRDVAFAFQHSVTALRVARDDWTSANFIALFFRTQPGEREILQGLLRSLADDPDLMQASGNLPEDCVQVAHVLADRPLAKKLVARLVASQRPSANDLLAWQAFHGEDMPYDLEKARQWARLSVEANSRQGSFTSAYIESVAGPTPEARAAASEVLHRLADSGHERATYIVAYRHATGMAEPLDPARALEYYHRLSYGKELTQAEMYHQLGLRDFDPAKVDLPNNESFAPSADTPPQFLKGSVVFYPRELASAGFSGEARVTAMIDETGRPRDITVSDSTHPLLSAAAEATARFWRFSPARKNGRVVDARISQTLLFQPRP